MSFARAFGELGVAPGQFVGACGVAIARGLLVVSEGSTLGFGRLQVMTLHGLPLQALKFPADGLEYWPEAGICADERRILVTRPIMPPNHPANSPGKLRPAPHAHDVEVYTATKQILEYAILHPTV